MEKLHGNSLYNKILHISSKNASILTLVQQAYVAFSTRRLYLYFRIYGPINRVCEYPCYCVCVVQPLNYRESIKCKLLSPFSSVIIFLDTIQNYLNFANPIYKLP